MSGKTGLFGNGQDECEICKAPLVKFRAMRIKISKDGADLAELWFHPPLCEAHNGADPNDPSVTKAGEHYDVKIAWEPQLVDRDALLAP